MRGGTTGEGGSVRPADPWGEAVGVVVEGFWDEYPLPYHHVPVTPGVRAGKRPQLGEQLIGEPQADPALSPDHREDRAAGQEGVAAEHPADGDLGEVGGEVVQPGAELEEEGAHGGSGR